MKLVEIFWYFFRRRISGRRRSDWSCWTDYSWNQKIAGWRSFQCSPWVFVRFDVGIPLRSAWQMKVHFLSLNQSQTKYRLYLPFYKDYFLNHRSKNYCSVTCLIMAIYLRFNSLKIGVLWKNWFHSYAHHFDRLRFIFLFIIQYKLLS